MSCAIPRRPGPLKMGVRKCLACHASSSPHIGAPPGVATRDHMAGPTWAMVSGRLAGAEPHGIQQCCTTPRVARSLQAGNADIGCGVATKRKFQIGTDQYTGRWQAAVILQFLRDARGLARRRRQADGSVGRC